MVEVKKDILNIKNPNTGRYEQVAAIVGGTETQAIEKLTNILTVVLDKGIENGWFTEEEVAELLDKTE